MKFRSTDYTEAFATAFTARSQIQHVADLGGDSISCMAVIDVDTPTAKTFDSGIAQVTTLTFANKAGTASGDYVVMYDTLGSPWAAYADKTGSDPAPTGAIWLAIPSAQKGAANITATTTAASVAAAFELAFDALVSVPFATDDAAADGTMLMTMTLHGLCTAAGVHNTGDTGAGSIAEVLTTAGTASEVDVVANTVAIPLGGLTLGLKGQLTTTGTLPAGLALATDYFIIPVDANTFKFATSLVNAQAGTAVNITSEGTSGAVNTFTSTSLAAGAIKLQQSNDAINWVDLGSSTNITVDAVVFFEKDRPTTKYVSALVTLTAGHISANLQWLVKGDLD